MRASFGGCLHVDTALVERIHSRQLATPRAEKNYTTVGPKQFQKSHMKYPPSYFLYRVGGVEVPNSYLLIQVQDLYAASSCKGSDSIEVWGLPAQASWI